MRQPSCLVCSFFPWRKPSSFVLLILFSWDGGVQSPQASIRGARALGSLVTRRSKMRSMYLRHRDSLIPKKQFFLYLREFSVWIGFIFFEPLALVGSANGASHQAANINHLFAGSRSVCHCSNHFKPQPASSKRNRHKRAPAAVVHETNAV